MLLVVFGPGRRQAIRREAEQAAADREDGREQVRQRAPPSESTT